MKTWFFLLYAISLAASCEEEYFEHDHQEEQSVSSQENRGLIDLESLRQDFVLETKQIFIPGCPNAFNPSIVRWKGSLLLSFRIYKPNQKSAPDIGLVWLDDECNLRGEPQILRMPDRDPQALCKRQDPRLIVAGDRLLMVFNNVLQGSFPREIRKMYVTEVHSDGSGFFTRESVGPLRFEGENWLRYEKNWVPINYGEELLLGYSITPHKILRPISSTTCCETCALTESEISWDWGVLRGGTPALKVGDDYLAFFHSVKNMATVQSGGKKMDHYYMGAYTFASEPPFQINRFSKEPIVGDGFYTGVLHKTWKPLRVVFPAGFVFDENFIWVAYGRQDNEIWIAKLDRKTLLNSLETVK